MSRQASTDAQNNVTAANNRATGYGTAAGADSAAITPYYQRNLTNPQGYTPAQAAEMLTSSSQSLGGSEAAAFGTGNLMAARDRNAAGVASTADDVARNAMKQQSTNALGVDTASTNLANQRQADAASGLSNLYNTNTQAVLSSLGLSNAAIGQLTNANQQSASNWMAPLQDATSIATGYASHH
jgi:hypothetical protein